MKHVNFFVLALALMGALVAMYACTARTSGSGIATAADNDTTTAMNTPTATSDDWKPGAVLAATTGDLKVSGPYTHKNLEIYLVHGEDQAKPKREILTLEEALERKQAIVHETGNVGQLTVENLSPDADIYVQSGDIVQGGKQDRVLAADLVLSPKSGKVAIASFCVEQGRWGARGAGDAQGQSSTLSFTLATSTFKSSSNALPSVEL